MAETTQWLSGIVSLVGAWIAISPFVLTPVMTTASLWNNIIIGAAIFLIAGYNYYRLSQDLPVSVGAASLVALLGLWMIVAPLFVFTVESAVMFWSNVVSGAAVAIIAGYNAYAGRETRQMAPAETT